MKKLLTSATIIVFLLSASVSTTFAQNSYTAKKSITLGFSSDDGTNACAVAWNPARKIYYSVIAGNETFPLEAFSEKGDYLTGGYAGFDARSLWYNATTGKLEGNGAGDIGLFSCDLGGDGKPGEVKNVFTGQNQPDFQSVGAFDGKKLIYYLFEGKIYTYKHSNGKASKSFDLKNCPSGVESLNTTTVVYTGRKGEELGVLDFNSAKVYLFDAKGKFKATILLPEDSIVPDMFRFSFANDRIWLYDTDSRNWTGYTF